VVVTCEHGGNRVPAALRMLFRGHAALLSSHRGWDPGALQYAQDLSRALGASLVAARTTRLLVDLNRSPGHPALFSAVTRTCNRKFREHILEHYYRPYRRQVETRVRGARAPVLHLSAHSFTPRLGRVTRRTDIGLLYDPARPLELKFCKRLQQELRRAAPGITVRRNYPYRGTADGLTTHLRRQFGARKYAGIEIEINQKFPLGDARRWKKLRGLVVDCMRAAVNDLKRR
jgi:predicted N-formylglutamate amidohydrolase